MHPVLRLYEDVLSSAENVVFRLPPLPRFIFVLHGSAKIADQAVNEGEAWQGEAAITVKPKSGGGTENGTSFALAPCLAYQARHASRPFRAAAVSSKVSNGGAGEPARR